jgi:ribonuclease P protein component
LFVKKAFSFEKKAHLKRRADIQSVFKKGKVFTCKNAKLFILKNDYLYNRICFSFSRGFGNSVKRNYDRRISRESFRLLKQKLKVGYDIILLIYTFSDITFTARARQLETLFSKAGIISECSKAD